MGTYAEYLLRNNEDFRFGEVGSTYRQGILGIYEWMLRGHFSRITIESEKRFRYDYGNSGSRGYYTGSYALNDNLLTLVSDSVISEELIHIIEGQDTVRRDLDKTEFMFIVTKKGLHQKNIAGDFWKKPSLIKK